MAFIPMIVRGAIVTFVSIVVLLQVIQPGYDGRRQFLSELVLGPRGALMTVAFIELGAAIALLAMSRVRPSDSNQCRVLLGVAGVCIVLAGLFPIGRDPELHEPLIFMAFFALIA